MTGKFHRVLFVWMTLFGILLMTGGCAQVKEETGEKKDIDFTVVRENEIPEDLLADIEENKKEGFHTVFRDTEYLYIAVGYGEQQTGGYSVAVEKLYALEENIHLRTKLIGPKKGEQVHKASSYPYLVLKLELREGKVVFE